MLAVQLKMARVALGLTVRQAAEAAGVSHDTITRIEAGHELKGSTVTKVRTALEAAGVIFVAENGDGPGVRLRKVETAASIAERIDLLETKAASIPNPGEPSPETGMNILKKAVVENDLVRLQNRRKELKKG